MPSHPLKAKKEIITITIDGPAGAGKSTIAKRLAQILNVPYLDTGAMYRALTLKALREGVDLSDQSKLTDLAKATSINLEHHRDGVKVFLDGNDVSEEIRTPEVTNNTFYIAQTKGVREVMVEWQRAMGSKISIVAEGRDIGTVVFPKAKYKFYLDADLKERSNRRLKELVEKGKGVDSEKLMSELKERDHKDLTRKVGPLKKAEDAHRIDSTTLSIDQVVEKILGIIKKNG